jgi:Uri superfamily endonuclease
LDIEHMTFDTTELPQAPGTYVLIVRADYPLALTVGCLGTVELPGGLAAYVGSARGPGGLRARIGRHLRADKSVHWHIDALTALAPIVAIWLRESPERLECSWAQTLAALATVPIPRFGSSDCRCPAHLFTLPAGSIQAAWAALGQPVVISLLGGDVELDGLSQH